MRVNSTTVSFNKPTNSVGNDAAISGNKAFSPRMESTQAQKKTSVENPIIDPERLMHIATALKNGEITKEQASEHFVREVIDSSVPTKLSAKDRDVMAKDISDIFADDPDFVNKLQSNLRELA